MSAIIGSLRRIILTGRDVPTDGTAGRANVRMDIRKISGIFGAVCHNTTKYKQETDYNDKGGQIMLNLQDIFLNQIRKDKTMVTVYLINGFQLRGTVKGFDSFTIIIENEGRQNLVYKNAVSTITPVRPVKLMDGPEVQEAQDDKEETQE